jgi:hypothetical protein
MRCITLASYCQMLLATQSNVPTVGPAEPGDIEIRFRKKSPLDVGELDVVVEVRSKLFESRVHDKQRRTDLIRDAYRASPGAGRRVVDPSERMEPELTLTPTPHTTEDPAPPFGESHRIGVPVRNDSH